MSPPKNNGDSQFISEGVLIYSSCRKVNKINQIKNYRNYQWKG